MPIDRKRCRVSFQRLALELAKLTKDPAPENVHKMRTNSRRVEVLLREISPELTHNDKKLLKMLMRLRKKAGRVRDLDVEIAALRSLKILEGNGHKAQLREALVEERSQREKKLGRAFDKEDIADIRRRLKRAAGKFEVRPETDPLALTLMKLAQLSRDNAPLTERTLHQYRIVGKQARYLAELAGRDAEAKHVVQQLKRMQDVVGDWHDWLKLTQKAEARFGGVRDSALVALLRNVTQAKFRQSIDAVAEIRRALSGKKPESSLAPGRKPSTDASRTTRAVA